MSTTNSTDQTNSQRIYLKDYLPPSHQILSCHLHFNLHETATIVSSKIQFKASAANTPLKLNGVQLELVSIRLNEKTLSPSEYQVTPENLTIFSTPLDFTLEIQVKINPEANKSCEGLYLSQGIFTTQCEAEGFRHITYFMDRPDVMTSYTVDIEADQKKYPLLLSNGDRIHTQNLGHGRHQATWKDPFKKPSYLFALVAGNMGVVEDHLTTRSGKKVKLEVFAPHGKQNRCHHAMQSLKKAMKWDEERFGLEYDLNQYMIVSIDDFNMGAMENKGLNIFNSRLVLADPASATDADFDRIESVVGHEYFHNWTGNRVTCRNWFELSLKEGLTVFRDQEFSSDMNSRAVQRIKDVDALRLKQFTEDAGPNSHPVRPESCLAVDNFYTPTIYEKGSEVIRMMQTIVGKKGFRRGMDEYFKRHDGQAVTILDFVAAISDTNQVDLTQFKLWYTQAGTPEVDVTEAYDAHHKVYTLHLKQSCPVTEKQPHKKPFHIPLLIGLIDSKGHNLNIKSKDVAFNSDQQAVLHLTKSEQTFVFDQVDEKPTLSLNREFSAPIKLNWKATDNELLHLIKFDSDFFNRRESCYKMYLEELKNLISKIEKKTAPLTTSSALISALGAVLTDEKIDLQFKALILEAPAEDILAQDVKTLNAESFHQAYQTIAKDFVQSYDKELLKIYHLHHSQSTPGDRAIKNRILNYLIAAQHPQAIDLAFKQYSLATNMTDQLFALAALCETITPERTKATTDFYSRWKDDSVVFNKWLQVQAQSSTEDTFQIVQKLLQTPPFSLDTPNYVYSLIGVFADNHFNMQKNFNTSYPWLADQILKIDQRNPQVGARLCGSFNFVKKLPDSIRHVAQQEIKRMLNTSTLSKNSRELIEGCL